MMVSRDRVQDGSEAVRPGILEELICSQCGCLMKKSSRGSGAWDEGEEGDPGHFLQGNGECVIFESE